MNISLNLYPSTDEEGKPKFEASACTEEYKVEACGETAGKALRALQRKLADLHRFSRVARSLLENKIGFHKLDINFKIEKKKDNENKNLGENK